MSGVIPAHSPPNTIKNVLEEERKLDVNLPPVDNSNQQRRGVFKPLDGFVVPSTSVHVDLVSTATSPCFFGAFHRYGSGLSCLRYPDQQTASPSTIGPALLTVVAMTTCWLC